MKRIEKILSPRFKFNTKTSALKCLLILAAIIGLAGCATMGAHSVGPTPIEQAKAEIPEDQLLDVGILVFESEALTPEDAKEAGTNSEIRKAESNFIPYHLKNTLHQSGHWGAIQVVPAETNSVDLLVKGKIIESNGERLILEIDVADATGKRWFKNKYSAEASENSYTGTRVGEKDAYQDLYNRIANDMAKYKIGLTTSEIKTIRTVSKLKFAQEFAPAAFGGYLTADKDGRLRLNRLPAEHDPMMDRLLQIREREYMYLDTLNQHYASFYNTMWPSYNNWRELNLTERQAISKIRREALAKQLLGALLVAGGIASGVSNRGGSNIGALEVGLIMVGGAVFIDGWNVSKEAQIHSAAIEELSESFGNEMQPITMEFEGKQYELTGSAEEQFKHWKELLHQIYLAETGFDAKPADEEQVIEPNKNP
jgi:hypothetical protein